MKKQSWWSIANQRREKDAFGVYYRDRTVFLDRVKKLKSVPDSEYRRMKHDRELKEFLGIKSGSFRSGKGARHTTVPVYEVAAGKKEILGTFVGDGLKLIKEGKLGELRKNWRHFIEIMKILDAAGIVDRKTGGIDRAAINECIRQNRIVHKR